MIQKRNIILGTPHSLKKVKTQYIRIGDHNINRVHRVRNIGAVFNELMKMEEQVGQMCKNAWLHLYKINQIREYLTTEQLQTIVHAFVTNKLDCNNSLLAGLPACTRHRLQLVQNAAAKLVKGKRKYDYVTPLLKDLHCLPIKQRIRFKLLLLCYKALNGSGPVYIRDMLTISTPKKPGLRSADDHLCLDVPRTHLVTYGDRAFSSAVTDLWNKLPLGLRGTVKVNKYKSDLKTYLYQDAFPELG